jgi:hypothetical protein
MTVISHDDSRLVYMKRDEILSSKGFCNIVADRWFMVHPETGDLIFWQTEKKRAGSLKGASPQCNGTKSVAEHVHSKMFPWAKIEFFERVAIPIELSDYS